MRQARQASSERTRMGIYCPRDRINEPTVLTAMKDVSFKASRLRCSMTASLEEEPTKQERENEHLLRLTVLTIRNNGQRVFSFQLFFF